MKNIFLVLILAFTFGCEDDDGEIVHRSVDARFIDIGAQLEDASPSDRELLDAVLPVADGILPPLDMVLPLADSGLVDAEASLVDSEAPASDLDLSDVGVVDAALSDM